MGPVPDVPSARGRLGKYVPEKIVGNAELAALVDTSDEWIRSRTGIAERRIAADDETTSTLAVEAAWRALETAGVSPSQLDLIIVATATPDHALPATACLVQDALGATHAAAFDLSAGCTGFIYALGVAADMVTVRGEREGAATALVIGAETLSRITDWTDRGTCVLFGMERGPWCSRPMGHRAGCWRLRWAPTGRAAICCTCRLGEARSLHHIGLSPRGATTSRCGGGRCSVSRCGRCLTR